MNLAPHTIVHVINTGGPGGAETVCVNLARGLDPARWRSVVVVPDDGWIAAELRGSGIETVVLPHRSRMDVIGYARALSQLIRTRRAAVIQSHLFGPTVVASALGVMHRIPVIGTLHGEMDVAANELFAYAKFEALKRGSDRLVFVSEPLRTAFLSRHVYPATRTLVIPNGSRLAGATVLSPSRALRAELRVTDDEFLVGAVGNLRPAKGYDVFLHAAALLVKTRPGYRFVIAGQWSGSLGEELLALRDSLGLREAVSIIGFRADIASVMGSIDLCAVTSRTEGFSLAAVEAMAFGRPVVATRCGGPETILEHERTGVLVANGSAEAVADAIDALRLDAPRRAAMGAAAREAAVSRFTLEAQVAAYDATYVESLARRRSSWRRTSVPAQGAAS